MPALIWRPTTTTSKTGNVPTAFVRHSVALDSCQGCHHAPKPTIDNPTRGTGGTCYAWKGRVVMGWRGMKAAEAANPHRYTLRAALAGRAFAARIVRMTAIGDPTAADPGELHKAFAAIEAEGLTLVGYTALWWKRGNGWLRSHLLASTGSDGATSRARARGFRVAQTVDADRFAAAMEAGHITTRAGFRLRLCANQAATLRGSPRPPTCNACQACNPERLERDGYDGEAFARHGPTASGRRWTQLVTAARAALTQEPST